MRIIVRCLAAIGVMLCAGALGAGPASAGGGCHGPLTDATGVHVEVSALCFTPTVLRVQPGTTVNWVNRDGIDHTVTASGDSFDGALAAGQAFSQRFGQSGVFPYYCHFHPGMVGVVIVANRHPAATGTAGGSAQAATPVVALAAHHVHHSTWPWMIAGVVVITAALVSFGAWRTLQVGRGTATVASS